MIRITFVVPHLDIEETVEQCIAEYAEKNIVFDTTHIIGVEDAKRLRFDSDIVIARGMTSAAVKKYHPQVTVIDIPVTGYEVLRAIDECRRNFFVSSVAIIAAENMVYGAQSLSRMLDVDVTCYKIDHESDAESLIETALDAGADAIIGGLTVYRIAAGMGLKSNWIKSGRDAVRQAVEEAIRASEIRARERERAEFLKIVMDYTHEAILAVDRRGTVTAVNKAARSILGPRDRDYIGTPIGDIVPSAGLLSVMERGEEVLGSVRNIGDTMIAANLVPIRIGDEVTGAVATFQNVTKIQEVEERIRQKIHSKGLVSKYDFGAIVGRSDAIRRTIESAATFATVDANVLIIGETGTGKELFAHSIHAVSNRSQGPFVAINCAALPENLLDSELFGYAEGAFTGASTKGKAGLFELAHKGTIFLDEIGEISLALQAKLLRVLQEREIMRIGDERVIPIDVRVIAATNKDLGRLVAIGEFRNDILYRLDVLRVNVPALRNRPEDVPVLVRHYLESYCERFHKPAPDLTADAEKLLLSHRWPGNVRELMNVCERIAALVEGPVVDAESITRAAAWDCCGEERWEPFVEAGAGRGEEQAEAPAQPPQWGPGSRAVGPEVGEAREILAALRRARYNKTRAAAALGMSRTTLWRKLRRLESA